MRKLTSKTLLVFAALLNASSFQICLTQQTRVTPSYIPPVCQGKPITVIPREVALAQTSRATRTNLPITQTDQLQMFDTLAKTISDVYLYPDFNGLDWPKVVAEYRKKITSGVDTEAFYKEMESFVGKLGDEHSYFESPVKAADNQARLAGQEKLVGVGALFNPLLEKKRVVILAVIPGSAADHAGLKQHDSLIAVDGLPIVDNGTVYRQRTLGPECSAAVLTIQSPGQQPREVRLVRYQVSAAAPIYARLVKTIDGSRIGYIFLPSFFDVTIPERVKKALEDFGRLDGLIIDNRMNTGGAGRVVWPMLSYFTAGTLGTLVSRAGIRPLTITPVEINNSQTLPLVILISKDTVSYGEIFSGILQDMGRAKLVGQTTSGHTETLRSISFPNGAQAWIAQERFDPANSHTNWKKGVKPDREVVADWDTFTFDNDPAVAEALKLLGHN